MGFSFFKNEITLNLFIVFWYNVNYQKVVIYLRKVLFLVMISILLLSPYTFAQEDINLIGEAAILIDMDCDEILYEKNAHEKLYPASTTKIMTAILALENGNMKDMVTVDEEIISLTEGAHIALDYDEEILFEDLINAMMIASGNDAALSIGKHIGGSLDNFVKMMNEKAKELGANNTHFVNPNGLHEEEHYSTAYDLYLITKYAMENEDFREIVKKSSYVINPTNKKDESRYLYNTNKFLYGNAKMDLDGKVVPIEYEGITGVKTGTTSHAKSCLVSFANRSGRNLLSVVLKSSNTGVYADTTKLLNHGFNDFQKTIVAQANEFVDNINIENGELPYVSAILDQNLFYSLSQNDADKVEKVINLNKDIKAPILKGDVLGTADYYLNGKTIGQLNIVSTLDVEEVPAPKFYQIILDKWYLFVFGFLIVTRIIYLNTKARKRKRRFKRNYSQYY